MIKKIKSLFVKIYIRVAQKKYKKLKYLYQPGTSKTLIVTFSGFSGENRPAKYNYIKTLRSLDAHRLFILDDFGYLKQGSYYLGEDGEWFVPPMVIELIQKIQTKKQIEKTVMVGSSKGGSAALYYSIKTRSDACIIGAPQYFIGNYLNIDKHLPILRGIMGNVEDESIEKLNRILPDCVCSVSKIKPKVYIHYSPQEHTYSEHIVDMLRDLRSNGFSVAEDANYNYSDHGDVAKYFPLYLLSLLEEQSAK